MLTRRALFKRAAKLIGAVPMALLFFQTERSADIETITIRGGTARCGEQGGFLVPEELAEEIRQHAESDRIWTQEITRQFATKEDEIRVAFGH